MARRHGVVKTQGHHVGFGKLTKELRAKGAADPKALAAWIGRRKYGPAGMAALSVAGRRKARKHHR